MSGGAATSLKLLRGYSSEQFKAVRLTGLWRCYILELDASKDCRMANVPRMSQPVATEGTTERCQ